MDGGFESRHEPCVAAGGGIGRAGYAWRVWSDSANETQGELAEPRVAVPREERFAVFPKRDVGMHTAAIVSKDWFRHEGHRSVVPLGNIPQDVFVVLHVVAHGFEGRVTDVDLCLAGCRDFVMLAFNRHACFLELQTHFIANVLQCVHRRDWEIPFLRPNLVTEIWKFFARAVPMSFDAIDDV